MRVLRFMSNLWISFSTCTKLKNVINKHHNINIYLLALMVALKKMACKITTFKLHRKIRLVCNICCLLSTCDKNPLQALKSTNGWPNYTVTGVTHPYLFKRLLSEPFRNLSKRDVLLYVWQRLKYCIQYIWLHEKRSMLFWLFKLHGIEN